MIVSMILPKMLKSFVLQKKKLMIPLILVLIVLFFKFVVFKPPAETLFYTVSRENLVDSVTVSGNFQVASDLSVSTPSTGVLKELYVENGQEIEKGDELFYVEATATTEEKAAAYASYQAALSALQTAQNTLRDKQAILDNVYDQLQGHETDESFTQKQTRTTAEAAKDSAYSSVQSAQAALSKAKLSFDETKSTTVYARASGTVVNLLDKLGDQVDAGSDVLSIVNFSGPHITISISENYIPRISVGQKTEIVFDALRSEKYEGIVELVDSVGKEVNGVVTYNARVSIPGLPEKIKPGMSALVTVETLRKDNVLDVPNASLVKKNDSYFVTTKSGKTKEVTLGAKGTIKTEIVSGLGDGDVIVANPQ